MSGWSWEYMTTAEDVAQGLGPDLLRELDQLGRRLADAASVKYLGDPPVEESGVSGVQTLAEGPWLIWYLEHQRFRTVFITRVRHL